MLKTTPHRAPEHLSDVELEHAITTLAANIAAATAQWLGLIAEFDRREAWGGCGVRSCAHWLNWKCGIALGAAREKIRVAHALGDLPRIGEAFARGELSYSKVRAMTRIATPDNEDYLLTIARHGTAAHVEQAVRAYRYVDRLQADRGAETAHVMRACRWYYDEDGMLVLKARLPAETGAVLVEALAAATGDLTGDVPAGAARTDNEDVPAGTSSAIEQVVEQAGDPVAARRADALCHLADQFLAHTAVDSHSADRHQIVVHVDPAALQAAGEYTRCDLAHGPAIAPATARRLACDAALLRIDENGRGEPLSIGRKTRTVPAGIRRFLRHRDNGCRFPGCTQHRHVDAHHVRHWADGGPTSADNLVLMCRHHHRLVHEGGFAIERRDDGRVLFFTPEGALVPDTPRTGSATQSIDALVAAAGIDVSAETCVSLWQGERMDLDRVVAGLMPGRRRLDESGGAGCVCG